MQNIHRKNRIRYLLFHLALIAAAGILLLLYFANRISDEKIVYCVMHDILHLYCPFCGGTRVLLSLVRLDFRAAFLANPVLLILALLFLFFDLLMLFRLLRRDENPFRLPDKIIPIALAALFLYAIARNILLITLQVDPLGDLLPYYQ